MSGTNLAIFSLQVRPTKVLRRSPRFKGPNRVGVSAETMGVAIEASKRITILFMNKKN